MIDSATENIVRILLEETEPITTQQLAFRVGVSQSGVKQRITYAREIIENNGGFFDTIPSVGIIVNIDAAAKLNIEKYLDETTDYTTSSALRFNYITECLLTYPVSYTLSLFSEELNTGKYIIRKDLAKVESWLNKYDLELVRIPSSGLRVEGKEESFRIFLIKLMRKKFQVSSLHHHEEEEKFNQESSFDPRINYSFYEFFKFIYSEDFLIQLQDIVKDIENEVSFSLSDSSFTQMIEYLAVMKYRIENMHILKSSPELAGEETKIFKEVSRKTINTLIHNKHIDDPLEDEVSYLAACLMVFAPNHIALRFFDYKQNIEIAEEFLSSISVIMNCYFKHDYGINVNLALFFEKLRIQNKYAILKSSGLRENIKLNKSTLYGACVTYKDFLEDSLGFRFYEDDLTYLTAMVCNDLIPLTTKMKAVFITGEDDNLSRYSRDYWNDTLENILITDIVKMEYYEPSILDDFDLGISTLRISHPKVVNVSRNMNTDDIKTIEDYVSERIAIIDASSETKLKFEPEIVECNLSLKDKNAILKHGYELLRKHGYVDADFWPSLLETILRYLTFIEQVFSRQVYVCLNQGVF